MPDSTSEVGTLNEIYKKLALLVNKGNIFKIFEHFKGQQITFPMK